MVDTLDGASGESNGVRVVATNQDGIVLTIDDPDALVIGRLEKNDDQLATIEYANENLVLIRYEDGTIESIF